jgi:hypothetical protein
MEFRRMTGALISDRPWPANDRSIFELTAEAKEALSSFYEWDAHSFRPKTESAQNAPEEVWIVGNDSEIILKYSLSRLAAETGRSLSRSANAPL